MFQFCWVVVFALLQFAGCTSSQVQITPLENGTKQRENFRLFGDHRISITYPNLRFVPPEILSGDLQARILRLYTRFKGLIGKQYPIDVLFTLRDLEHESFSIFSQLEPDSRGSLIRALSFGTIYYVASVDRHNTDALTLRNYFNGILYFSPLKLYNAAKRCVGVMPNLGFLNERRTQPKSAAIKQDFGEYFNILPKDVFELILDECFVLNANFLGLNRVNRTFSRAGLLINRFARLSPYSIARFIFLNVPAPFDSPEDCWLLRAVLKQSNSQTMIIPKQKFDQVLEFMSRGRHCRLQPHIDHLIHLGGRELLFLDEFFKVDRKWLIQACEDANQLVAKCWTFSPGLLKFLNGLLSSEHLWSVVQSGSESGVLPAVDKLMQTLRKHGLLTEAVWARLQVFKHVDVKCRELLPFIRNVDQLSFS